MRVEAEDADDDHGSHAAQGVLPLRNALHEARQLGEAALHLGHAPVVGARPGQRELLPAWDQMPASAGGAGAACSQGRRLAVRFMGPK